MIKSLREEYALFSSENFFVLHSFSNVLTALVCYKHRYVQSALFCTLVILRIKMMLSESSIYSLVLNKTTTHFGGLPILFISLVFVSELTFGKIVNYQKLKRLRDSSYHQVSKNLPLLPSTCALGSAVFFFTYLLAQHTKPYLPHNQYFLE